MGRFSSTFRIISVPQVALHQALGRNGLRRFEGEQSVSLGKLAKWVWGFDFLPMEPNDGDLVPVLNSCEPRTCSLCCAFGAPKTLCHPPNVSLKLLCLILQGNVSSCRYRAIVAIGCCHRFMADSCIFGP